MPFETNSPYKHDVFTVKQYGENHLKITYCKTLRESGWEDERKQSQRGTVNDVKLDNNLSRAKSTVQELAMCNPWDYWCTFTINPEKYDRMNLKSYFKDFAEFIHNYNRRSSENEKVKYLLVPEQHKDGAWHLHGFIKGIRHKDLYKNSYGYLTWKQYEKKFGFISIDKLKDKERASSYVLKYMTKDSDKNVTELNANMYYCSKGLERAKELYRGNALFCGEWDWEQPEGYVKIKNIDTRVDDIHNYLELEV